MEKKDIIKDKKIDIDFIFSILEVINSIINFEISSNNINDINNDIFKRNQKLNFAINSYILIDTLKKALNKKSKLENNDLNLIKISILSFITSYISLKINSSGIEINDIIDDNTINNK